MKSSQLDLTTNWRNPITYTGMKFDVLKSALQKFCRRGIYDKAQWCGVETFLIHSETQTSTTKTTKSRGKGLVTNMLNRIKTIALEDVSYRECVAVNIVFQVLNKFEASGRNDLEHLLTAIHLLVKSKKSRVSSHAYAHFGIIPFGTTFLGCITELRRSLIDNRDEAVKNTIFAYRLWDRNQKKVLAFKEFWDIVLETAQKHQLEAPIQEAIKHRRDYFYDRRHSFADEKFALISAVLLLVYFIDSDDNRNYNPSECSTDVNWTSYDDLVSNHEALDDIPDYVFDLHTNSGPMSNKTPAFFYNHSSVIDNEDGIVAVSEWKNSYAIDKMNTTYKGEKRKKRNNDNKKKKKKFIAFDKKDLYCLDNDLKPSDVSCIKLPKTKKVPCLMVIDRELVLKQMKSGFAYGREQLCVENLKKHFGINDTNGNLQLWSYEYSRCQAAFVHTGDIPAVYFVMDLIPDSPTFLNHRMDRLMKSEQLQSQLCRILFFRMIIGVSDTNLCNILIQENHDQLFSVDENFIGYWCIEDRTLPTQVISTLKTLQRFRFFSFLSYEEAFETVWGLDIRNERLQTIRNEMISCEVNELDKKMSIIQRNGVLVKEAFDKILYLNCNNNRKSLL